MRTMLLVRISGPGRIRRRTDPAGTFLVGPAQALNSTLTSRIDGD